VGVEDEGRDTRTVDKFQLRGREEVERLGLGHAARAFPHCQGLFVTIDAGMIALNAENGDHYDAPKRTLINCAIQHRVRDTHHQVRDTQHRVRDTPTILVN
jgi:hypothetical protein